MKIDDIQVTGKPLVRAKAADVSALEAQLWITFPEGYREYVTKLGEGTLGGDFVRIYPPWRIEKELVEWRQRITKYWFWDKGRKLLPKERALECVIVGDTVNGDELVFHPTRPDRLFVLPRDSEQIFEGGKDLLAAVEWLCSSGKVTEPFSERNFVPFDSRKEAAAPGGGTEKVTDTEGESLDNLVDLAKQWAKRHGARKMAQKDLKEQTRPGEQATLQYEALVMEGAYPFQPGYLAVYRIDDSASGLEGGIFSWTKTEDSHGFQFAPNQANAAKLGKSK